MLYFGQSENSCAKYSIGNIRTIAASIRLVAQIMMNEVFS
jgi:hypothetical protein